MNLFKWTRGSILVVDDDPSVRLALKTMFETEAVGDVYEARPAKLPSRSPTSTNRAS